MKTLKDDLEKYQQVVSHVQFHKIHVKARFQEVFPDLVYLYKISIS